MIADESLCRGCGACIERCPQIAQGLPATTVELHPFYLDMRDPYWTSEVVSRIDLEATTGKIPVSGTGQGDPHRGSGNDGIRFGHFHIVGPAQNLLYESSADAIAIQLGQRPKYLTLEGETIKTPPPRLIGLKTPSSSTAAHGDERGSSRIDAHGGHGDGDPDDGEARSIRTVRIEDTGNRFGSLILRLTPDDLKTRPESPEDRSLDLVEIELTDDVLARKGKLRDLFSDSAVLSAVITVGKEDVDAELRPVPAFGRNSNPFSIPPSTSWFSPPNMTRKKGTIRRRMPFPLSTVSLWSRRSGTASPSLPREGSGPLPTPRRPFSAGPTGSRSTGRCF